MILRRILTCLLLCFATVLLAQDENDVTDDGTIDQTGDEDVVTNANEIEFQSQDEEEEEENNEVSEGSASVPTAPRAVAPPASDPPRDDDDQYSLGAPEAVPIPGGPVGPPVYAQGKQEVAPARLTYEEQAQVDQIRARLIQIAHEHMQQTLQGQVNVLQPPPTQGQCCEPKPNNVGPNIVRPPSGPDYNRQYQEYYNRYRQQSNTPRPSVKRLRKVFDIPGLPEPLQDFIPEQDGPLDLPEFPILTKLGIPIEFQKLIIPLIAAIIGAAGGFGGGVLATIGAYFNNIEAAFGGNLGAAFAFGAKNRNDTEDINIELLDGNLELLNALNDTVKEENTKRPKLRALRKFKKMNKNARFRNKN
ncbi:unnamed protein product [Bursaphelenchus okinawaensis]|uniref:DUF148 domain-containing protein n=1 Tax=Bursaphelenchus okinawaensis TaxID=465554 RepID=A0A811L2I6_9BILA|nr:unnamed protein product [Bursaphelenchus okinawaensis]CAG9115043.1 unnamed protein product [Bursaphelenchus okinawaensis]